MRSPCLSTAICCLISILVCLVSAERECYGPLCDMQTAFRIESLRETDFLIPNFMHTVSNRFCIKIKNYADTYCSSDSHRRIIVPFLVYGVHDVYVSSDNDFSSLINKTHARYYVSSLPDRPLIPSQSTILEPQFSSILEDNWNFTYRLDQLADDYAEGSMVDILGISRGDVVLNPRANFLTSTNVEPASWFLTLVSQFVTKAEDSSDVTVFEYGYPLRAFYEFILSPANISSQRVFSNQWMVANASATAAAEKALVEKGLNDRQTQSLLSAVCVNPAYVNKVCEARIPNKKPRTRPSTKYGTNICIWGSNKLDGQKSIWLQQVKDLPDMFRFTWVLTSDYESSKQGTLVYRLGLIAEAHNQTVNRIDMAGTEPFQFKDTTDFRASSFRVSLVNTPFHDFAIEFAALDMIPSDGAMSCNEEFRHLKESLGPDAHVNLRIEEYVYKYAANRLKIANYVIAAISPVWVQSLYMAVTHHMQACRCDVLVYGNDRGFNSDILLRDSARMLNIPQVAELLNLFMVEDMVPTVVVAPSLYAYNHDSIAHIWRDAHKRMASTKVVIIPPGVDAHQRFNKALIPPEDVIHPHGDCKAINAHHANHSTSTSAEDDDKRCIHIAFIARLAPEKNIGLFILAAHTLLQTNPYLRFTLVGDGLLKERLTELVEMLEISWAVKFLGWVDYLLPRVLASVDLVINPSIRGWSETFCIANIEIMSMEVPLITFGVGGIGDYVAPPPAETVTANPNATFFVTPNAVLVNVATPEAIADAALFLIENPTIRKAMAKAGRQTVLDYFTVQRQMEQYSVLYAELVGMVV